MERVCRSTFLKLYPELSPEEIEEMVREEWRFRQHNLRARKLPPERDENGRLTGIYVSLLNSSCSPETKERHRRLVTKKYSEMSDEDYAWVCGAKEAQAAKDYAAARQAEAKTRQQEPKPPEST